MLVDLIEIRRELKTLLSIKDDLKLRSIVITAEIEITCDSAFLSFKRTNHYLFGRSNVHGGLIQTSWAEAYPQLFNLVKSTILDFTNGKNPIKMDDKQRAMTMHHATIELRHRLLGVIM